MCRLSIIVPYLGQNEPFEDTLVSVLQNRPPDCEVLVAHRGPYEDPYQLSGEVRFVPVAAGVGLLAVANAGLEASSAPVVHLLKPGVVVQEGWAESAEARFSDRCVGAVAPLLLDVQDPDRILAAGLQFTSAGRRVVNGAGLRRDRASRVLNREIVAPTLAAAFYRRSAVLALGGFCSEAGEAWADADLGLALRWLGFCCVLEPQSVLRCQAADTEAVADGSSFAAGRYAERVFWRYRRQSGTLVPLLAHSGYVAGSALANAHRPASYAALAGRLRAALEWSGYRKHCRRLQRAATAGPSAAADEEDDGPATARSRGCRRRIAA